MKYGRYRQSTGRYGGRSIGRSSKDSRKELQGVSDEVLSEQPISRKISRMIDIRGIVKLLGKSKLELIFISDSSTCLHFYSAIYSELPTTPYRQPSVSLTLLYYNPSYYPLIVLTITTLKLLPYRADSIYQTKRPPKSILLPTWPNYELKADY